MANYRYRQIADDIRSKINTGFYRKEEQLPTEEALSQMYHCSRQTVRQALQVLLEEKRIEKIQGSGTYVKKPAHIPSQSIAIITTYISEYIFPSILHGIEDTVSEEGYSLVIKTTNNSVARERKILLELKEKNVDGIIVEGTKTAFPNPNVSFYEDLASSGIPIVFFNGYYAGIESEHIRHVVVDDYEGGILASKTLSEEGHVKIGGIFKADDMQGLLRYSGFMDGTIRYGGELEDSRISWFTTETRKTFLRDLSLETKNAMKDITALVVYNDIAANVLLKENVRKYFPHLTRIFSFDGKYYLEEPEGITITSLNHPKGKIGTEAGKMILRMIHGENVDSVVMPWVTQKK